MKSKWRRTAKAEPPADDIADEVTSHIDHRTDDLIRAGLSRDEARRRARLEFGGVESYKEQVRDTAPVPFSTIAGQISRDVVLAGRRLVATPVFTAFAVLSLAVGLGVSAAFYSVMTVLLWPASGLDDPDRLVVLRAGRVIDLGHAMSRGDFDDFRAWQTTMTSVAGVTSAEGSFIDGAVAERFRGQAVTGNAFETLGIRMALGRPILPGDDRPGSPAVVVLSHAFWSRQLRADPAVIGRVVRLSGQPAEIVGVANRSLGVIGRPDLDGRTGWIALETLRRLSANTPSALNPIGRSAEALSAIGRLRGGATMADATAEAAAIGARLDALHPLRAPVNAATNTGGNLEPRRWGVVPATDLLRTSDVAFAWLLVALVALVLVVACTNLANLMLARGSVRRQEIAVRRALGASRWRLVCEQMAESVLVAVAGGVVAVAIIRVILVLAARQIAPGVQFHLETDVAPQVVVAGAVALGLTVLVFGLWPALHLTRQDPRAALVSDAGTGAIRWRSRRNLIVGQVAISAGFLLFAALCVTAVARETRHEAGIVEIDRLATAQFSVRGHGWDELRTRRAIDRVLELASVQPTVDAAAITSGFPIGYTWEASLSGSDDVALNRTDLPYASFISATPEIFHVLGLPIVQGRAFDARDVQGAPRVAVISEAAARAAFGTSSVVGRQVVLRVPESSTTTTKPEIVNVVGVVADASTGGRVRARSAIYVPFAQRLMPSVDVVVRTSGNPEHLLVPLRTVVRQADPDLFAERSVTGVYRLDPGRWALGGFGDIATLLGLVVLTLAMTGLSGVLTHLVARRTRELGVRMALGASRAGIARLVLGDGIRPVTMGLAFGIPAGLIAWFAFSPVARLPTSVIDLPILGLVPAVLVGAAMVACYLPARRAARVDPNVALKDM